MSTAPHYRIGPFTFRPERNELSGAGKKQHLEDRASRVLEFLCQNVGAVVSKEQLIAAVWQGRHLSEQSVPVVISNLRKALSGDGTGGGFIETIPKRGYRLTEARAISPHPKRPVQRWFGVVAAFAAVIVLGIFFWQSPETEARKPGVILTLNDIQNATGDETLMSQVIAMSEAGSHYLSQAEGILLIRHWWNVEAEDPTGGIFERYGKDAPVYHVSGTLIKEGDRLRVTLFLNDPKTDEVLWSESYAVASNEFMEAHLSNLGKVLAVLGLEEQISPPGFEDQPGEAITAYWLGLYLWHLGSEGAAKDADRLWTMALQESPDFPAALLGRRALKARWPNLVQEEIDGNIPIDENDSSSLVQAGAIALYRDDDPDAASNLARKAIQISPNDFAAYALLAECLVKTGDIKGGLKAIREARLLAPFNMAYPKREAEISKMVEGGD